MTTTYDYTGKVVIVTGGGRGLGLGITRAFVKTGATVIITGRTESTLQNAADELREELDADIHYYTADGTIEKKVQEVIAWIYEKFGQLDVLVNNAQAETHGPKLQEHTTETFDEAIQTGLYATFYYMKYSFPLLKESKGSIINMGSGAGITGMEGFAPYAANKEAIRGLTRVAASEWSRDGINSNTICPAVETPAFLEWAEDNPEDYQNIVSSAALRRLADPEIHVGGTCLFLASPEGKQLTGRNFDVDGGQNLRP